MLGEFLIFGVWCSYVDGNNLGGSHYVSPDMETIMQIPYILTGARRHAPFSFLIGKTSLATS